MEKPKRAIVNFSKGAWYPKGQERLKKSLEGNFDGDYFSFSEESNIGSPPHQTDPYAFKLYAIERVREMGYNKILWCDSSLWAVKDVSPVFDWIDANGYMFHEDGNLVGRWCNAHTRGYFNLQPHENDYVMFSAGFSGFDFTNELTRKFWAEWKLSQKAGCFKGSWQDHRHDMTCGSIIANRMGMKYVPAGTFMAYIGGGYSQPKESAVFHLQGM